MKTLIISSVLVALTAPVAEAANGRYDYYSGGLGSRYDYFSGGKGRHDYGFHRSGGAGRVSINTSVTHQGYDDPDSYTIKYVRPKHVGLPSGVYGRNRNLAIK